ncbi:dihydrofolate reductase [Oxalobacter sp. OxGP1]|uniref:dihydrofolate reductase n=1 Tax=Oxalobacter paeniformigenes TaxID=2946594 RepID=UPI0022AF28B6|nr:dihydrofolate reductase [Oxalobacter paeniformigenes]MCZ4053267.1 dihydrofolate reductase [Oxalobacter paeniformigenes]
MEIAHVVAMAENRVIGKNGRMPWHIPGEQKIFRNLTVGKALILGRKTHESIGRVLPDRTTIIVTRQPDYHVDGAYVVHSVQEGLDLAGRLGFDQVVIGGGGELFAQTLQATDRIYLSVVHAVFEGETYYPELPDNMFAEISRKEIDASIPYAFVELENVSKR